MNHKTFIAFKKNASLPISEIPPSFKTFASSSKKSFVVILHRVAVDRKTLKYRNKKFQSTNRQRCSSDYWLLRLLRLPKTANDCQRLHKRPMAVVEAWGRRTWNNIAPVSCFHLNAFERQHNQRDTFLAWGQFVDTTSSRSDTWQKDALS